ncbi:ppsA [Symbiodinium sp. CCMP2592]|nr:ppsA [Symbiodinium sp. CCMP2592]
MEPRQRHALETGYEAIYHAGFRRVQLQGLTAAVYVGAENSSEWPELSGASTKATGFTATGAASSILAGRISFVLGLKGPAVSLDVGDCSSLSAVHFGAQVQRECGTEMPEFSCAVGVSVLLSPRSWPPRQAAGLLGATGRCRVFDATASGAVPGEGTAAAVLWRKADEEQEGFLEGTAMQHVGRAASLTAPSCPGEQELVCEALRSAAVAPSSLDSVELHGWCHVLDDGVGVVAAARALEAGSRGPGKASLCIGSIRSGHGAVEAAQGIAALLRLLAFTAYGALAPAIHLRQLNPYVASSDCDGIQLAVEPVSPRLPAAFAGATSSGFGTNAHAILWSCSE